LFVEFSCKKNAFNRITIEIVNACFFFLHSKNTKEMIAIWERDQFGYPVCIDEKHVSGFWRCGGES
jgi:hypothetical protein